MNVRNVILGAAMATLALACTSAPRTDGSGRSAAHLLSGETRGQFFDRLDANHSGSISRAEAQASPELVLIFVDMDTNADGELNAAEWVVVPLVTPDGIRVP